MAIINGQSILNHSERRTSICAHLLCNGSYPNSLVSHDVGDNHGYQLELT